MPAPNLDPEQRRQLAARFARRLAILAEAMRQQLLDGATDLRDDVTTARALVDAIGREAEQLQRQERS